METASKFVMENPDSLNVEKNVGALDERFLNAHVRNGQEVYQLAHQQSEEQRRTLKRNNISVPSTSGFSPEIVHPFSKALKRMNTFADD
ncbi:hypothetical protein PR048_008092 [Dryococelus australis]|uniref:Uncharacterized protein n=1 Tax=Dryococelus australis TaxID=614101 RepID=A0ABQ9HW46_9NEOP|nr:hypothetical protein PR048_008092 [Dryococelus australis]